MLREYAPINQPTKTHPKKGFIVLNPIAGAGNPEETKHVLQQKLGAEQYDLYETTGEESIADVVQNAVQEIDYAWVAAIGGDGTVTQVADGLVGLDTPLMIIPAGTGNALAQEFNIPQETEEACDILLQDYQTRAVDAICVGTQYFLLQLGIGLESLTMEKTPSAQKNRWGALAYLWNVLKEAFGWQPHQFTLTVDEQSHQINASELVIANARNIGVLGLEWDAAIEPDDGRIDIAVVRARSLGDYVRFAWALIRNQQRQSDHIQFFSAQHEIGVDAKRPLPIHGDGEILDLDLPFTAITATVVPKALTLIVPMKS